MPTNTIYSTINALLYFRYCACILGMLSLVSCNKAVGQGDRKSLIEDQKRQAEEKAEAKRVADDRVLAEEIGTQAAALAATPAGFEQHWNESPTIQK